MEWFDELELQQQHNVTEMAIKNRKIIRQKYQDEEKDICERWQKLME